MTEYHKYIVTFIDILGFKKIIEKENNPTNIANILEKFQKAATFGKNAQLDAYEYNFVNFSDTIVRAVDISSEKKDENRKGNLLQEIHAIFFAQKNLTKENILLRGSITFGDLYLKDGYLFGPALNQAYKLEKENALYPRVIIDPLLLKAYDSDNSLKGIDFKNDKNSIKELIRMDFDGWWHIDYLKYSDSYKRIALPNGNKYYLELLSKHREIIIERSSQIGIIDNISSKLNWLVSYHNQVVSSLSEDLFIEYDFKRSDVFINPEEIPIRYNF